MHDDDVRRPAPSVMHGPGPRAGLHAHVRRAPACRRASRHRTTGRWPALHATISGVVPRRPIGNCPIPQQHVHVGQRTGVARRVERVESEDE